jgi:hypothetical protein
VRHCHCHKHTKSGPRACGVLIADKRATSRSDSGLDQRKEQAGVILYSGDRDFEFRPRYHNKAHFRTCINKYIKFDVTGIPQDSECSNWSTRLLAFIYMVYVLILDRKPAYHEQYFSLFPPGKFPRYTLRLGFPHHFQSIIYHSSRYSTLFILI